MKLHDRSGTHERLSRIERMIQTYRLAKHRRLMRLATRMWRETATEQQLAKLDARPDRIH